MKLINQLVWLLLLPTWLCAADAQFLQLQPITQEKQLIYHSDFSTTAFSLEQRATAWTLHSIGPQSVGYQYERPNRYQAHPVLPNPENLSAYRGSGWHRGHLIPAGDMHRSKEALEQTFYYTNIVPQDPYFNTGIWLELEKQIRRWAQYHKLYIFTGAIYQEPESALANSFIKIPSHLYKIVIEPVSETQFHVAAYLFSNDENQPDNLSDALCSIDHLETLTGHNFFHFLPDDIETLLETQKTLPVWSYSSKAGRWAWLTILLIWLAKRWVKATRHH